MRLKPDPFTELCMIHAADGGRERMREYPRRSAWNAPQGANADPEKTKTARNTQKSAESTRGEEPKQEEPFGSPRKGGSGGGKQKE